MKTKLTILLVFITAVCFSQPENINYKALIKDGSNNILTNQNVTVQFTITNYDFNQGGEVIVYQEEHMTTTDSNGIVILNIGEGNELSGLYYLINWGSNSHYLNVKIDTGGGLIDLGTTEFMAVPYALSAANVSGLEKIDEGNGQGWRLMGKNPDLYGNIGYGAVDLSQSGSNDGTNGATGYNSFASGINTKAIGTQSTALGAATIASGHNSVAMGQYTRAEAPNSTAIGLFNVGGGDPLLASATDPLFEIGNGTYSGGTDNGRSNALTVLRNGNATLAGTLTQNSDRRLKTNISTIQYGLNTILKLNPVSYNWIKQPEQTQQSLGLIAQEVQLLIKEIVKVGIDKEQTLSLSYIELIPVLIKAIQEQHDIINSQDTKINSLTAELEQLKTLDQRVKQLETLTNDQQ